MAPGFETDGQFISSNEISDSIIIYLKTKPQPLQKNLEGYEKDGWEKWSELFLTNFLGSFKDEQCKIKNRKALKFRISSQTGELMAISDEPLIIENKALGYTVLYKLESFHYNFKTFVVSYTGYSFFQPMNGNTSQQREWEMKRKRAYSGSLMHFMRSVYRNKIEEEGFDVRSLKKVLSLTKTTQNSYDLQVKITDSTKANNLDSENDDIEDQILNPDNYRDVIGSTVPGDSIAYAIDKTTAGLYFDNFLLVNYRGDTLRNEEYSSADRMSQLVLINKRPLEIEADGSFYDYRDLMVLGYWMWAQKVAFLLPFDYVPPKSTDLTP